VLCLRIYSYFISANGRDTQWSTAVSVIQHWSGVQKLYQWYTHDTPVIRPKKPLVIHKKNQTAIFVSYFGDDTPMTTNNRMIRTALIFRGGTWFFFILAQYRFPWSWRPPPNFKTLPALNMFEQDENDDRFLSSTNTDGALVVLWIGFLIPCVAYGNAI